MADATGRNGSDQLTPRRATLGSRMREQLAQTSISQPPQRIAFWSGHLCERGTDTALYDYADCAETELGMHAYVLYDITAADNFQGCVTRFATRFGDRLVGVSGFAGVDQVLEEAGITLLYLIKIVDDLKVLSRRVGVRNLVHAVFFADRPHGHVYARISPCVPLRTKGRTHDTPVPVVPHIVRRAVLVGPDLRAELGIPPDATVFGRHGGFETFDIPFVREIIVKIAHHAEALPNASSSGIYFLLMNTPPFCDPHPRVVHLAKTSDADRKAAFIRSCDAMIHARQGGESFGLAIAEFSSFNKPVITSKVHHDEHAARFHLDTLAERGLYYHDARSLAELLLGFDRLAASQRDWNCYRAFEPAPVMQIFRDVFLAADTSALAPTQYTQPSPKERELIAKMEDLDAQLSSTVRLPSEPEESFAAAVTDVRYACEQPTTGMRTFICVHRPYVYVRYAPSTCAGVAGKVMYDELIVSSAQRGAWVRLHHPQAKARWMLVTHPLIGELLRDTASVPKRSIA